jgi:hypothetical protein
VAGQERHPPAADLADRERCRRCAVGRVDRDLFDIVEQGVQARSADDPDVGPAVAPQRCAHADFASLDELEPLDEELLPDDESDEDEDDDVEPDVGPSELELDELDSLSLPDEPLPDLLALDELRLSVL